MARSEEPVVTVSCVGGSAQYFPSGNGKLNVPLSGPESILKILEMLGFSSDLVMFALVNGVKVDLATVVGAGDDVVLVSPLMGG